MGFWCGFFWGFFKGGRGQFGFSFSQQDLLAYFCQGISRHCVHCSLHLLKSMSVLDCLSLVCLTSQQHAKHISGMDQLAQIVNAATLR